MCPDLGEENENRCPALGGWAEGRGRVVHHSGEEKDVVQGHTFTTACGIVHDQ